MNIKEQIADLLKGMTFGNRKMKYSQLRKFFFKDIFSKYPLTRGLQVDKRGTDWFDNINRYKKLLKDYE